MKTLDASYKKRTLLKGKGAVVAVNLLHHDVKLSAQSLYLCCFRLYVHRIAYMAVLRMICDRCGILTKNGKFVQCFIFI